MALRDITRGFVEAALTEAATIGREAFLAKYGYGPARSYFIEWNGQRFDSKAIAGVAHQYVPGHTALSSSDFSGGEDTVAVYLRRLGFVLIEEMISASFHVSQSG